MTGPARIGLSHKFELLFKTFFIDNFLFHTMKFSSEACFPFTWLYSTSYRMSMLNLVLKDDSILKIIGSATISGVDIDKFSYIGYQ